MSLEITYHGHSTFLLSDGTHSVLIDPFLTGNPAAVVDQSDIECTHIAVSHGHEDHITDVEVIAKRCDATVFAIHEITTMLGEKGIANLEPGNTGGRIDAPFGYVAFTQAFHSSSLEGRYYLGMPLGLIISIGGHTVYFAGDTGLFSDMKLIAELYEPDVAILPIGDRYTMGPKHASIAAEWIKPRIAIPCHFNTWPPIEVDASLFAPKGVEVVQLAPGETHGME